MQKRRKNINLRVSSLVHHQLYLDFNIILSAFTFVRENVLKIIELTVYIRILDTDTCLICEILTEKQSHWKKKSIRKFPV